MAANDPTAAGRWLGLRRLGTDQCIDTEMTESLTTRCGLSEPGSAKVPIRRTVGGMGQSGPGEG
jgi:hypothetical protein